MERTNERSEKLHPFGAQVERRCGPVFHDTVLWSAQLKVVHSGLCCREQQRQEATKPPLVGECNLLLQLKLQAVHVSL